MFPGERKGIYLRGLPFDPMSMLPRGAARMSSKSEAPPIGVLGIIVPPIGVTGTPETIGREFIASPKLPPV
jgi:hypothetical protein